MNNEPTSPGFTSIITTPVFHVLLCEPSHVSFKLKLIIMVCSLYLSVLYQHYVIKFVSDLQQGDSFHRFPPQIK